MSLGVKGFYLLLGGPPPNKYGNCRSNFKGLGSMSMAYEFGIDPIGLPKVNSEQRVI